jgi:DNA-binding NtrC family response regulator
MVSHQRILIVDQNPRHRKQLGEIFEPIAKKICLVSEFEESLQRCRDEPFDIVFSELRIGGGEGLTLLWQLRQLQPELAAVLMSSRLSSEMAIEATRLGVADCLLKPINSSAALAGLERAMRVKARSQKPPCTLSPPMQLGWNADPNSPVAVSETMRPADSHDIRDFSARVLATPGPAI